MKSTLKIIKYMAIMPILIFILFFNANARAQTLNNFTFNWLFNHSNPKEIVTIIDLKPGKIQTVSGIVEALCDDEFILRDNSSPIVVKVDLELEDIALFQGEKVTITGIYQEEELEAFEIKRANGEVINLNSAN